MNAFIAHYRSGRHRKCYQKTHNNAKDELIDKNVHIQK